MKKQLQNNKNKNNLKWYLDAKFGMFIHWGAYTVAGAEASWPIMAPGLSEAMFDTPSTVSEEEYVKLPEKFNPTDFDAEKWVKIAKDAGMKYIVITSKHHDGFCMFDAPGTDYKITNTSFGRDVCLELANACKKEGMKLGFYYSPPDMWHTGYRDTSKPITKNWLGEPKRKEWGDYLDYMESHIRKLLTDYGEISVIWFDGICNHKKYDTSRFHKLVHELSPNTLINDRLGDDYDFVTPEQFIPTNGIPIKNNRPPSGDGIESEKFFKLVILMFKIPIIRGWVKKQIHKYAEGTLDLAPVTQESFPPPERFQPWETCMTIGQTWAYNPNETQWKSPKELIKNLSLITGHGGNYLLNVGPTDKGEFPSEIIKRLSSVGEWMKDNDDSIYGNTYTPLSSQSWGTVTRKDKTLYLHVHEWPKEGELVVKGCKSKVVNISIINGKSLKFTQSENNINIIIPKRIPDKNVSILVINVKSLKEFKKYSLPQIIGKNPKKYIRDNAIVSALINGVINGLIALFSYRMMSTISALDAGIDVLITVGIIVFLTSWLVIKGTRKDLKKGKVSVLGDSYMEVKKPINSLIKALLIMFACVIVFGGLLNGLVFLAFPDGFTNWGYIIFKTLYTSASGALAVIASVTSVFKEKRK